MFTPTLKRTEPISESKKKNKQTNERFDHAETVNRLKTWWSNEAMVHLWQVSNSNLWEKFIIWHVESQVVFIFIFDKFLRARDLFSANEMRKMLLSLCWAPDHEHSLSSVLPLLRARGTNVRCQGTWVSP